MRDGQARTDLSIQSREIIELTRRVDDVIGAFNEFLDAVSEDLGYVREHTRWGDAGRLQRERPAEPKIIRNKTGRCK